MKRTIILAVCLWAVGALAANAWGNVPVNISIQGRLTDSSGEPLPAGIKGCSFAIFDAETDGSKVWPASGAEAHLVYTGDDGLWQAFLGSVIALPHAVFADTSRWLEVTMDNGVDPPEVFSRIKLTSLPFAYRAYDASEAVHADSASAVADFAVSETKLEDGAVTNQKLAPDAVTSDKIQDGTMQAADIAQNGATTGQVLRWNGTLWEPGYEVPPGAILMWAGTLASIPPGWTLCDGTGGTPDLSNRFVYGVTNAENPGATGGVDVVGSHNHAVDIASFKAGFNTEAYTQVWEAGGQWVAEYGHSHVIDPPNTISTASGSHDNKPPYYKLAFIMKL